jgi:hypothetical protein
VSAGSSIGRHRSPARRVRVAAGLVASLACLGLAACGDSDETAPRQTITLTVPTTTTTSSTTGSSTTSTAPTTTSSTTTSSPTTTTSSGSGGGSGGASAGDGTSSGSEAFDQFCNDNPGACE